MTTTQIADQLVTAFEGGSNYWASRATVRDRGGGYEIDTPEFHAATIRFIGGPRADEEVS